MFYSFPLVVIMSYFPLYIKMHDKNITIPKHNNPIVDLLESISPAIRQFFNKNILVSNMNVYNIFLNNFFSLII